MIVWTREKVTDIWKYLLIILFSILLVFTKKSYCVIEIQLLLYR